MKTPHLRATRSFAGSTGPPRASAAKAEATRLEQHGLRRDGAEALADGLEGNATLTSLSVLENNLGAGADFVVAAARALPPSSDTSSFAPLDAPPP